MNDNPGFTPKELRKLRSLKDPHGIQKLLDAMPYHLADTAWSPRKVLAEFGRAFGRLPDNLGKCTKEQEAFVDHAVAGLSQEGKVISVRLALFAEMIKGKPWTPATLKDVGGMEGVGVWCAMANQVGNGRPQRGLHR